LSALRLSLPGHNLFGLLGIVGKQTASGFSLRVFLIRD